ncbi:MAG: biotin/lipoyl-binding protein [Lachnospiraceae bacterium]|nr:biotin/lipoyl-binding protein [Lachnospiraceae bacterium]
MKRRDVKRTLACIIPLLFSVTLSGCGQEEQVNKEIVLEAEEESQITYEMSPVVKGDVAQVLEIKCIYSQTEEIELSFAIDKEVITDVYVEKGDVVKKGDKLVSVDVETAKNKVDELEYQLAVTKLNYQQLLETKEFDVEQAKIDFSYTHMKEDDEKNMKENLQNIEENYKNAIIDAEDNIYLQEKRLEEAKDYVEKGTLYAPIDGIVNFLKSDLENTPTNKGEKVVTIYDENSCYFCSDDIEVIPYLDKSQTYTIVCGLGKAMREYSVEPVLFEDWKDKIYFKLLDQDYDPYNITTGTIEICTEEKQNVLTVDKDAIHSSGENYYVYILDEEGIRRMQFVELGLWGSDVVEVISGLEEGDYVIV